MFDLSRDTLERHSLDMRQFIDFRQSTLPGGQRIVEMYNSSGLSLTLLPDRGLDIWAAQYKGQPLTWLSQGSPHPGGFGTSWLRLFSGGLLTTCGLTHVGPPETDPDTGEHRDIHGDYSRLPAHHVASSGGWDGENYVAELTGVVAQGQLFSEQLRLTRVYRVVLGQPEVEIVDVVKNCGDMPSPLMVLYHFNVGYPLVREGTVLHVPNTRVIPRDAPAVAGKDRWHLYDGPVDNYAEQVFFHHVCADEDGMSSAVLENRDWGLQLSWDTRSAPYLTQWKNTRAGIYVSGLEPSNSVPEGQNRARSRGRLPFLAPGESVQFTNRLRILEGADAITQALLNVDVLRATGKSVSGVELNDYPTT